MENDSLGAFNGGQPACLQAHSFLRMQLRERRETL